MLQSDWYKARLRTKQQVDRRLWQHHVEYLTEYCARTTHKTVIERLNLHERLQQARERLEYCQSDAYIERIKETLGVDPTIYS
jgi:hypothetical protein